MNWRARWQGIEEKVDALSLRERVLLFLSAAALVYLFWEIFISSGISARQEALELSLATEQRALQAQQKEAQMLAKLVADDASNSAHQRIKTLQQAIATIDQELAELSTGMVPADQLPVLLEDVLAQSSRLHLVELTTLPVETLSLGRQMQTADDGLLYKHAVSLHVQGSYMALLGYLKDLEALNWSFYWDSLRFELQRYPSADIHLQVFTLSSAEGPLSE